MVNLNISRQKLLKMTIGELKELLGQLGEYLDTPEEKKARLLRKAIYEVLTIKLDYGF